MAARRGECAPRVQRPQSEDVDELPRRRPRLLEFRRHARRTATQSRARGVSRQSPVLAHPAAGILTMKNPRTITSTRLVVSAAVLFAAACADVTVPNYNNPTIEQLTSNPTVGAVNTAVVGMLINLRGRAFTEISALGILGKESYNLDQAEPRNVL